MKKVKLMALGLMVMMIQSVGAVTLPSASYTPYSPSEDYSGFSTGVVFSSGSVVSGSYKPMALGAVDPEVCVGSAPGIPKSGTSCSNCCNSASGYETCIDECMSEEGAVLEDCESDCGSSTGYDGCMDACNAGPSLPLDGGLSILLALAIGSGAVRALRRKK